MPHLQQLISFHIIEVDKNKQMFMTWTYPTISEGNKSLILSKVSFNVNLNKSEPFTYCRNKDEWIYINFTDVFVETDKLNNSLKCFALVLVARDLNPEKYSTLGRILSKCYCKTGTPVELVKLYLSVYTTGSCSTQENGIFVLRDFDNMINNNGTKIKELINLFGLEIILLYTSILLKKRVAIYHHSEEILLKWMPSICALMLHRDPISFLFPTMSLSTTDINELKVNIYYVAGFKDSTICSKPELYDLLVNLPASEISIMPHAKESLTMTKIHKDIAMYMVQLAENTSQTESQVIKEITNKTNQLLNYLRSLSSNKSVEHLVLTKDIIKSKNLPPAVEIFLINLASVENYLNL